MPEGEGYLIRGSESGCCISIKEIRLTDSVIEKMKFRLTLFLCGLTDEENRGRLYSGY